MNDGDNDNDSDNDNDDIVSVEDRQESLNDENESEEFESHQVATLNGDELLALMKNITDKVAQLVDYPTTIIQQLLVYSQWDAEKLLEKGYAGNWKELFTAAKIPIPDGILTDDDLAPNPEKRFKYETGVAEEGCCQICFDAISKEDPIRLLCDHQFCKPCWKQYITSKVIDAGVAFYIECPAHDCNVLIGETIMIKAIDDERIRSMYYDRLKNEFIASHPAIKWCPAPNCSNAIQVDRIVMTPVTCDCGYKFCFYCTEKWHEPIRCDLLKAWLKVCENSDTAEWMSKNTKECPKCFAIIEKNGGCNRMTCTNQNCRQGFCWVCAQPWDLTQGHAGGYSCNKYDDNQGGNENRATLNRFLFYSSRYLSHRNSLKFEEKLNRSMESKMEKMQGNGMSWVDVQFTKQAAEILCECRTTLMYNYAFAFYLEKSNEVTLFEDNQKDLESATEQLSECLERDLNEDNAKDLKQKVVDQSVYCERRRRVLLKHVAEGYINEVWQFSLKQANLYKYNEIVAPT